MIENTLRDRITCGAVKDSSVWMYQYYASEAMGLIPDPIATRVCDKAMRAKFKKRKKYSTDSQDPSKYNLWIEYKRQVRATPSLPSYPQEVTYPTKPLD